MIIFVCSFVREACSEEDECWAKARRDVESGSESAALLVG